MYSLGNPVISIPVLGLVMLALRILNLSLGITDSDSWDAHFRFWECRIYPSDLYFGSGHFHFNHNSRRNASLWMFILDIYIMISFYHEIHSGDSDPEENIPHSTLARD